MKRLLHAAFLASALLAPFAHADGTTLTGKVLESKDAAGYTYLRLQGPSGETWAAVEQQAVKTGATVTIENAMQMSNFESKALHKTFASIVFGNLQGGAGAQPHGEAMAAKADLAPVNVSRATGPNARTVAEVVSGARALKDKPVEVHAKVVKYNPGIMGKNWVHLQDGSGKAGDGTNDILVTTLASTKPGDVVTVSGTVRTDKDFGAGYAYKVLIEEASLK